VLEPSLSYEDYEGNVCSFVLYRFSPGFAFDCERDILKILSSNYGFGKRTIATVDLSHGAEWVDVAEARAYAAAWAIKEGKIECPAVSTNRPGAQHLRVEIGSLDDEVLLKFYQYRYATNERGHDLKVGERYLSLLEKEVRLGETTFLEKGWHIRDEELPSFLKLVQASLHYRQQPLAFQTAHPRLVFQTGRGRTSLLANRRAA
jgi:hypothetical protein